MIAKMSKVFVAASLSDKGNLLNSLRQCGVVHIVPVDAKFARLDEKTKLDIDTLARAIQVLESIETHNKSPVNLDPIAAAEKVLTLQRANAERENKLTSLYRQIQQLSIWGDVKLEDFEALKQVGVEPKFYSVTKTDVSQIKAACVEVITSLSGKDVLVAVVDLDGNDESLPESATEIELPNRDRPSICTEAAEIDAAMDADNKQLVELTAALPTMQEKHAELLTHVDYEVADRSGLQQGELFAIQGWVPADETDQLSADLAAKNVDAAVQVLDPADDEDPPTLIRYPRWVQPIKALFDMLGTFPGYREIDLSPFFVIALPLFAAMLIGDAGYGLIFALLGLGLRKKLSAGGDTSASNLLILIGIFAIGWGILSANYFGITPDTFARPHGWVTQISTGVGKVEITDVNAVRDASGVSATIAKTMMFVAPLWKADSEQFQNLLIKISFIIACIHLVLAHVRKIIALGKNQKSLAELGWCGVLIAMFTVIWYMFFKQGTPTPSWVLILMGGGVVLTTLFSFQHRNPVARVMGGFASSLLPLISTFSDTMSYIRLMAVGLASYYIAFTFNSLAAQVAEAATWGVAWIILLFGHGLNIGLCVIAIFAHGVRLNMLEFSNNVGVQWAGRQYQPFANRIKQEN
ncbi:MAG: hypothetical protein KAR11_07170 [Phycisphaerae bacterium]|nr:hypothetical protein [Phycisphaerae bacterium]